MKTKRKRKPRLYGKDRLTFRNPVSAKRDKKGFSLRIIEEADGRLHVVKTLHTRLKQLLDDTGSDTLARHMLAARAVFIAAYLESVEVTALEGTKEIDWKRYLQATKSLSDVLSKLGLNREAKKADRLHEYINKKKR
jgi:hypothetical protein